MLRRRSTAAVVLALLSFAAASAAAADSASEQPQVAAELHPEAVKQVEAEKKSAGDGGGGGGSGSGSGSGGSGAGAGGAGDMGKDPDAGFWHAFMASLSFIIISELGDKTFFIAAVMAMRHDRFVIFVGAFAALAVMTVLSAAIGFSFVLIPREVTWYGSVALFFFFGVRLFKDAWFMSPDEGAEELEEVTHELDEKEKELEAALAGSDDVEMGKKELPKRPPLLYRLCSPVMLQAFTLTFLAEWGDRSQITTIVLAAKDDPYGVTVGGSLGHAFCTALAVLGGRLLAQRISVRNVSFVGAFGFLFFAVLSLAQGPNGVAGARDAPPGNPCGFPPASPPPRHYVAYALAAHETIVVDGRLDDAAWASVGALSLDEEIRGPGWPSPTHRTDVRMRFDDTTLYIGARVYDSAIWANQTQRNSVVFRDNDFEVFIDPAGSCFYYKELEVNAIATLWTLTLKHPYLNGGPPTNWLPPGVVAATFVDGVVNDPLATQRWWSVELAIPFAVYTTNNTAPSLHTPPRDGEQWRINFSRVEYTTAVRRNADGSGAHYVKQPAAQQPMNWVWTPQYAVNMHLPERWGFVEFSRAPVNTTHFALPRDWGVRVALAQCYYACQRFQVLSGYYTTNVSELVLPDYVLDGSLHTHVPLVHVDAAAPYAFVCEVRAADDPTLPVGTIDSERHFRFAPPTIDGDDTADGDADADDNADYDNDNNNEWRRRRHTRRHRRLARVAL